MKQVFNYWMGTEEYASELDSPRAIEELLSSTRLDGVELLVDRNIDRSSLWAPYTIGVHLRCWYNWLPFYLGEPQELTRYYPTQEALQGYFGGTTPADWIQTIRDNVAMALRYKPCYLVWHITQVTPEEAFTFCYKHSNRQVLQAAAEVYNQVADMLPSDVTVLFENLWWSGLTLRSREELQYFLELVQGHNVGIMLDTGHLLNTELDIATEDEAIDFLIEQVLSLGDLRQYIKGMHLNLSLSGAYRRQWLGRAPKDHSMEEVLNHVFAIDQHRPFSSGKIARLIELVEPIYLNHELGYKDVAELKLLLAGQMKACWG